MPALTSAELDLLRSGGHAANLYLIVQQPMYLEHDEWTGYLWACQVNGNPPGDVGDLVATLTVDNGETGPVDLYDGMTVFVGSTKGAMDRGIYRIRTDQTVNAATNTLSIGASSEVVQVIQDDDWVVVLDEFRIWRRDPRITEAAGVLSWYKDYDVTWDSLGGSDAARREASLPPVPVMSTHAVAFIDVGMSASVDFDWSNSYATYPAAAVNDWDAWGEDGGAGWSVLNTQNPPAQTYTNVSGLAGYRVRLEVGSDVTDPPARFRRGIRYVFTLRRPGQTQAGDPPNAEPITDFQLQGLSGSFDQGFWRGTIRIPGETASEYEIMPGALVIVFSETWYGGVRHNLGLADRENILFVGHVADGSVTQDSETGDLTFDAISGGEQASNRESFPVAIEYDDVADEWYKCPQLTVDRAAWHYLIWHSTIPLVCDFYQTGNGFYIAAQDFLAGTLRDTIDTFGQSRLFARLLCDRGERFALDIDQQMKGAGTSTTIFTLQDQDWLGQVRLQEVNETRIAACDFGGVHYNAGLATPYLSRAPGRTSRQIGRSMQSTYLAIDGQDTLNDWAGRMLAYQNNRWPGLSLTHAGGWTVFDIWPQEYINVGTLTTERHTFSNDLFIVREISVEYNPSAGTLLVATVSEIETDLPEGMTVPVEPTPPPYEPPPPTDPPYIPPEPEDPEPGVLDLGRRILATEEGCFVTDNIGANPPVWYEVNNGFVTANDKKIWALRRDPFHWWTSGGTERTLYALSMSGLWKMEDFPVGEWVQLVTIADINSATGRSFTDIRTGCMNMSIEVEDRLAFGYGYGGGDAFFRSYCHVVDNGAIVWTDQIGGNGNYGPGWPDVKFAQHSASQTIFFSKARFDPFNQCMLYRSVNRAGFTLLREIGGPSEVFVYSSISIPYIGPDNPDKYVLYGGEDLNYQYSDSGGAAFINMPSTSGYTKIGTGGTPERILLIANQPIWTGDGQATWNTLPAIGFTPGRAAFAIWEGDALSSLLVGSISVPDVQMWMAGDAAWTDKTGNLTAWGTTFNIYDIQRDSMGSA